MISRSINIVKGDLFTSSEAVPISRRCCYRDSLKYACKELLLLCEKRCLTSAALDRWSQQHPTIFYSVEIHEKWLIPDVFRDGELYKWMFMTSVDSHLNEADVKEFIYESFSWYWQVTDFGGTLLPAMKYMYIHKYLKFKMTLRNLSNVLD